MTNTQPHFDAEVQDYMDHFWRETQDLIDEHHEQRSRMTLDQLLQALEANPYSLELKSMAHLSHTIPFLLAHLHFQDEMLSRWSWMLTKDGETSQAEFLDDLRGLNRAFLQDLPAAAARAHANEAGLRFQKVADAFGFNFGGKTR